MCPEGNEISSCEYKKLRKLPIKERLAYYDAMTEYEHVVLIEKHQHCLSVREKKSLFHESQ